MDESHLRIRGYRDSDFPAVCSLEAGEKRTGYGAGVFVRQAAVLWPATFFVADHAGAAAGFSVGAQVQGKPREGWIIRLAVQEEYRSRGIGRRLAGTTIEALRDAGARTVLLTVAPHNTAAQSLYRSLGFLPVRRCKDYFAEGEDRDILQLNLTEK
ncbi:N-acetyltransferase [Methanoregula sp.]|uniref:GNAT family N-acetyltransferase n=1 Tax=Methanoregula sp. TaxID=2052170 RepID=UPI0025E30C33|nr:N-acetyltransferase [Methanoregula sp.]